MTSFAYLQPVNDFQMNREVAACNALLQRFMLPALSGGTILMENLPHSDQALRALLLRAIPGDVVVTPRLATLSGVPSQVIEIVSALTAKGIRVFVVEVGDEINPIILRRYVEPFTALETALAKAEARLSDERARHQAELEEHGKQIRERMVMAFMKRSGMNLEDLLIDPTEVSLKNPRNPALGRDLRSKREALGLTMEGAGQLVEAIGEKAINKGTISNMERDGTGKHVATYEMALNIALSRRDAAQSAAPEPVHTMPEDAPFKGQIVKEVASA
ncbi:hypothetical protein [Mesorhizobium sp. L-8-3]|uniref:hypothetical protein n=1 Tax=Mesorhizobium sp. L-8-3 TaxID=2744522 RepID=UPI001928D4EC|nr:hypothetical protein [Mesorhizobium sp. L-8-3]BCH25776.1 hypothetical protein MesoLjLb_55610 [Mesorhizobium sp. L-8-3]